MLVLPALIRYLIHPAPGNELKNSFLQEVAAISKWENTVFPLQQNGLLPLFRSALIEAEQYEVIALAVREVIDTAVRQQVLRNLKLQATLLQLHEVLSRNNIPFALLKGFALASVCYRDASLRPMIDIDILVNEEDVPVIRHILSEFGAEKFSEPQTKFYATLASHEPGILLEGVLIEPHTTLFKGPESLGLSECICLPFEIARKTYQVPAPDLHLLFIMNHVHKHLPRERFKLLWLRDTACLMQQLFTGQEKIEEEFFRLADRYHCRTEVSEITALMLTLLPDLLNYSFKAPLPPLPEWMEPSLKIVAHYGMKRRNDPAPRIRYFSDMFNFKGKILFLAGLLFPSITYMKMRYKSFPANMIFLLYPYHFLRVFGKGIIMLLRFAFSRLIRQSRITHFEKKRSDA